MNTPNLINANSLHIPLADQSVQTIATSDPYFGLRDYKLPKTDWPEFSYAPLAGLPEITIPAWRGCYGLEPTLDMYIGHLVLISRELWRVLRNDGVMFRNWGDSYNGSGGAGGDYNVGGIREGQPRYPGRKIKGLKPKDLCMMPARAALALQADGWILRSDIIWSKPNPMPESVSDRCTKSHEYIFMFAKQAKYFYDAEAVKEESLDPESYEGRRKRNAGNMDYTDPGNYKFHGSIQSDGTLKYGQVYPTRNRRTVWTIATAPYSSGKDVDHFAAWPPALVDPMIRAGTSAAGCCPACGKAWVRVVEKGERFSTNWGDSNGNYAPGPMERGGHSHREPGSKIFSYEKQTTGWQPACQCPPHEPVPCLILDPFAGSGTTLMVARQLGRRAVGLDLSFTYLKECARSRLSLDALDAWTNGKAVNTNGYPDPAWHAPDAVTLRAEVTRLKTPQLVLFE